MHAPFVLLSAKLCEQVHYVRWIWFHTLYNKGEMGEWRTEWKMLHGNIFYKVLLCRQVFPEEHSYKCCGWPGPHQLHNNVLWLHPPKLRLREKSGKLTQNWPTYFCSVGNNLSLSKLLISDKTEEVWCSGQTGRALTRSKSWKPL